MNLKITMVAIQMLAREFSGKDSDHEMEEEDYEDNVDQNVGWLGIENQAEEERKMTAKGKMIAAAQRDI